LRRFGGQKKNIALINIQGTSSDHKIQFSCIKISLVINRSTGVYMKLLRIKQVSDITGLSHSSIYKQMREGRFPKSISITKRARGWREDSIFAWIESLTKC
jgi:prophage regulatory protein